MTQSFMDPTENLFIALIPLYLSERVLTFVLRPHNSDMEFLYPTCIANKSNIKNCLYAYLLEYIEEICIYTGVVVAIFVKYSISKSLLNQFKSAG